MNFLYKTMLGMRFFIPAASFITSIILLYRHAPAPITIAAILATVISYLVADPFRTLSVVLSRVTRWTLVLVILIISVTGYAYYYDQDLDRTVVTFVITISALLLLITAKLNDKWLDRDLVQDGPEVSCALVDDASYKYNRFFWHYGRSRCRSILDFHLRKKTPDEEMDTTVRYIFNLGVACADDFSGMMQAEIDEANEIIADLERRNDNLMAAMDRKVKARVAASMESFKDQLQNKANQIAGLTEANRQLKAKVSEFDKIVKSLDKTVEEKDEQLSRFDIISEECDNLRGRIAEQKQRIQELTRESDEANELARAKAVEAEEAQELAGEYFRQIGEMRVYISELETDAGAAFQEEISQLRAENQSLQERIRELEEKDADAHQKQGQEHDKKGGRPAAISEDLINQLVREYQEGTKVPELVSKYNISRTKVYEIIRQHAS
jgi:regulator of replication initiation timing